MNIEKIKQIAKDKYGHELTDEQAMVYAEKYGKMSDDELDAVTGGGCFDMGSKSCPVCGSGILGATTLENGNYYILKCGGCGTVTPKEEWV